MPADVTAPEVVSLLERIEGIEPAKVQALKLIWRKVETDLPEDQAWWAAVDAAGTEGIKAMRASTQQAVAGPAWSGAQVAANAAAGAVVGLMVKEQLSVEHYRQLVSPLEFVLDLPAWWDEAGSTELFLDMLEHGASVDDASAVVTALL